MCQKPAPPKLKPELILGSPEQVILSMPFNKLICLGTCVLVDYAEILAGPTENPISKTQTTTHMRLKNRKR